MRFNLYQQEVNAIHTLVAPTWLRWSQTAITFDQEDHPDSIPHPRRYLLVVSSILGTTGLTKVLMDGAAVLTYSTPAPLI